MKQRPALRIGTQCAVLIIPLFVVFSSISAAVSFRAVHQELVWGFEQEALALAVSTAAFFAQGSFADVARGDERALAPLRSLRRWGQLRTLALFDIEGRPLSGLIGGLGAPVAVNPRLSQGTARPHLGRIFVREDERYLSAFTPVRAADGSVEGWVRADISVEQLFVEEASYKRRVVTMIAVPTAVGCFLVLALTGLISPRLRDLTHAAGNVRQGLFETGFRGSVLREINDLVGTFQTLVSVLEDTKKKAGRSVVDHEQFRAPSDIAAAWSLYARSAPTLRTEDFEMRVAVGPRAPLDRCFYLGHLSTDGGFVGLVARLEGDEPLDLAQRSGSLGFFLEQHASIADPQQLIRSLDHVFGIEEACLLIRRKRFEPIFQVRLLKDGDTTLEPIRVGALWALSATGRVTDPAETVPVDGEPDESAEGLLEKLHRFHPKLENDIFLVAKGL